MKVISTFTIAILSYNRREYLVQQIGAALNQTCPADRVIVYDNCSPDPMVKAMANCLGVEWQGSEYNYGSLWNFQRAVDECTTDYIAVVHDDDMMHRNFVEEQKAYLDTYYGCLAVACRVQQVDCNGKSLVHRLGLPESFVCRNPSEVARVYINGSCLPFPTVTYRASAIKNRHDLYVNIGRCSDVALLCNLAAQEGYIGYQNKTLYDYRLHAGQDTQGLTYLDIWRLGWFLYGRAGASAFRWMAESFFNKIRYRDEIG